MDNPLLKDKAAPSPIHCGPGDRGIACAHLTGRRKTSSCSGLMVIAKCLEQEVNNEEPDVEAGCSFI